MSRIYIICSIFALFVACKSAMLTWSLFQPGALLNSTSSTFKEYANQRISALRNLRDKLRDSENVQGHNASRSGNSEMEIKQETALATLMKSKRSEDKLASVFKNFDMLSTFAKPLKKMISSKQGVEALASMMLPKRDIFKKLLDIKGHLEPTLRRYMTDKYNWFLTSLIPYSENIGVPPFVLNSMKIPQDFDPRWQFIKQLLDSQGGLDKFVHSVVTGEAFGNLPQVVQSRSGDETELISDQEPDASSKGYRKHQQLYLSSFKKRQMKPGSRLTFNQAVRPSSSLDYESVADQQGQFGHMTYDVRSPDDLYNEAYYTTGGSNAGASGSDVDMTMSASGYGGRGHGGGHGGGSGQTSYGSGFLDPFTILGGLAFLTYLGLLLQNSLNRNMTGRSLPWETRIPVIPISLLKFTGADSIHQDGQQRQKRSLSVPFSKTKPLTIEQVVEDVRVMWKEIEILRTQPSNLICTRQKLCKIVVKIREMNLQPLFLSIVAASTDDNLFFEGLLRESNPAKTCEPYFTRKCASNT